MEKVTSYKINTLHRYFTPVLVLLLFLTGIAVKGQREFTEEEKALLDLRIDSVIQRYQQLAGFYNEYTFGSLNEEYLEAFPAMFTSPDVEILNDLDPENLTPQKITVTQYIQYVREWHPYGLTVELSQILKKPPKTFNDIYTVQAHKYIQMNYKGEELLEKDNDLFFTIVFDENLNNLRISSIDKVGGSDSCNINKDNARRLLASGACELAKESFDKARQFCPSDPDIASGTARCDSCIRANDSIRETLRKPFYLTFHVAPGSSGLSFDGAKYDVPDITAVSGMKISYEIGVGAEIAVLKGRGGMLGIGLGIDYCAYSGSAKLANYSSVIKNREDMDNDTYNLIYKINSLEETDKVSYLQIPVYVNYEYGLSRTFALFVKAGGKFGLNLSHSVTIEKGSLTFTGEYDKYGKVVLHDLPEYNFRTYSGNEVQYNDNSEKSVSSMNISVFGDIGLRIRFSDKLEGFISGGYTKGFSDIGTGSQAHELANDNGKKTTAVTRVNSLFTKSKVTTQALGIDIGLKFKLFQY
ncbi:MAG TPA: outer membrane beta-barrel protein [Bacteroidales bacterium]|nr:outer membrane beta-barrel protein [Bacteroidales bacterium]